MEEINVYQDSIESIGIKYGGLKKFFDEGKTLDINFRIQSLKTLYSEIESNKELLYVAAKNDFNKSRDEFSLTEIYPVLADIKHTLSQLKKWVKPERRSTNLLLLPASSKIYKSPKGVVAIFAPWNFPFYLSIMPLVSAVAAGNVCILKPAHETHHMSLAIKEIISKSFHPDHVTVVTGDGKLTGDLMLDNFEFNHIFFTGSANVGKQIMVKAAKNLTPITLELGGKSPAIIEKNYGLDRAAKKIVWAKFVNAGQTCVAPDYVLVHSQDKAAFISLCKKYIGEFFSQNPIENEDYTHMVHEVRFDKVINYLKDGEVHFGGRYDRSKLAIEPTIITPNSIDVPMMKEEIFGPVLPIITYENLDEVVDIVRKNRYPLALYVFNSSSEFKNNIFRKIEFGGGCQHNALYHLGNPNLPFGGIQKSGIGNYHGYDGFLTFSNVKSVLNSAKWFDLPLFYQPYTEGKLKVIRKFFGI
jgi:aldehyde dehydrogenase (NAD+)